MARIDLLLGCQSPIFVIAISRRFSAAIDTRLFVAHERHCRGAADNRLLLDLRAQPDAQLEDEVDLRKLRDYCLNVDSPRGRHKARVFASVLGLTAANARETQAKLVEVARTVDAKRGAADVYGERYTIDFEMVTPVGRAIVRSG